MYHVWVIVNGEEVKFATAAVSRGAAVSAARRAYPDGVVGSVLPA